MFNKIITRIKHDVSIISKQKVIRYIVILLVISLLILWTQRTGGAWFIMAVSWWFFIIFDAMREKRLLTWYDIYRFVAVMPLVTLIIWALAEIFKSLGWLHV